MGEPARGKGGLVCHSVPGRGGNRCNPGPDGRSINTPDKPRVCLFADSQSCTPRLRLTGGHPSRLADRYRPTASSRAATPYQPTDGASRDCSRPLLQAVASVVQSPQPAIGFRSPLVSPSGRPLWSGRKFCSSNLGAFGSPAMRCRLATASGRHRCRRSGDLVYARRRGLQFVRAGKSYSTVRRAFGS